jgi:hypothetical protein
MDSMNSALETVCIWATARQHSVMNRITNWSGSIVWSQHRQTKRNNTTLTSLFSREEHKGIYRSSVFCCLIWTFLGHTLLLSFSYDHCLLRFVIITKCIPADSWFSGSAVKLIGRISVLAKHLCMCVCVTEVRTRGLMLTGQALHHLSHPTNPFHFMFFR